MKKGKFLFILLLCSTFITTHFISETYAKYTSSMSTTDSARAARWEINVENEVDLFGESVIKGLNGESSNEDQIIAPGTSGEYTFVISGTAETAYKIDIGVEVKDFTGGRIHYYLDGIDLGVGEDGIDSLTYILNNVLSNNKVFAPGCDLVNTGGKHTIGWVWEYEENDSEGNLYDSADTNLGIKVDKYLKDNNLDSTTPSEEIPGVILKATITATQVATYTGDFAAC